MKVLLVIPARFASTRYPGKPLVELAGAAGHRKSLIRRSWEAAMAVNGIDRVVVSTDDDRIRKAAEDFGAEAVMTSETCVNGTERCAETLAAVAGDHDIVVNLQGDAPLTPPWFVEDIVSALERNTDSSVATPVLRCDGRALDALRNDRANGRVGGTTAVFDRSWRAMYFSKEVIPHIDGTFAPEAPTPVYHHVGVYAYRAESLLAYPSWPPGQLENLEGLEQLRFMENGAPVLCVPVEARGREFWELNNPSDAPRIEAMLVRMGVD